MSGLDLGQASDIAASGDRHQLEALGILLD